MSIRLYNQLRSLAPIQCALKPTRFASGSVSAPGHTLRSIITYRGRFHTEYDEEESDPKEYIVFLKLPVGKEFANSEELESWYHSFLSGGTKSSSNKDPRMVRTFKDKPHGFVARLSLDDVEALAKKDESVIARPNGYAIFD